MRKLLTGLLLLCGTAWAQPQVSFKISRAVGVLTFLQAASGNGNMSATLNAHIWRNAHRQDSARLNSLVNMYRELEMGFSYQVPGYPASRQRPRSADDLLMIAAVQSSGVDDFLQRITGILPNETWLRLKMIMQGADPLYDKLVASRSQQELNAQLMELNGYGPRLNDIFSRLGLFYNSTWTSDIPFTVAIYAVPGSSGNTTATPHSNSLVMAVLTSESDHDMRVGVAVHEMCHVLYAEQAMEFQNRMDRWFRASKDPNSMYACNYIDEALATACGNGWAYEQLSGRADTGEWYDDVYINRFAKGIYPIVKEYMGKARQIDSAFVVRAIAVFSGQFPDAYRNYLNLMNHVNVYSTATTQGEWGDISRAMHQQFRISSSSSLWPVAEAMQQAGEAQGTQLYIVHKDHAATCKLLAAHYPELKSLAPNKEGITSIYDKRGRPVIVMVVNDKSRVAKGFAAMRKAKEINKDRPFVGLD